MLKFTREIVEKVRNGVEIAEGSLFSTPFWLEAGRVESDPRENVRKEDRMRRQIERIL